MCAQSIDFPLYYFMKNSVLFYCVIIIDLVAILGFFICVVFSIVSIVQPFLVMYRTCIMSLMLPMEW